MNEHDDAEATRQPVEAEGRQAVLVADDLSDPAHFGRRGLSFSKLAIAIIIVFYPVAVTGTCWPGLQVLRSDMMDKQLAVITSVVRRAPEWIRNDLLTKDPAGRERAEEALAAMIAAALGERPEDTKQVG